MDENCIFCKLASGEIPTATIYEDEDCRVIFDANPASKGHAILLPKTHAANLFELPDETAARCFVAAKKVAAALMEATGADGINLLQNNGTAAGQTVFHVHIHLIPRWKNDHMGITWKQGKADPAVLEELTAKVQEILAR